MSELYLEARKYLNVRWEHQGRDDSELDCVGLGVFAARSLGWSVVDRRDYSKRPKKQQLEAALEENLGPAVLRNPSMESLRPNDVVGMKMSPKGRVRHVGIVGVHPEGFGLSLIHTDSNIGRVVEQRIDEAILSRIAVVHRRAV